jgi:hypothetical protein
MASDYNENSCVQRQAFEHFWPWLEDAMINSTSLLPSHFSQQGPIGYVDYGVAGGANALEPFRSVMAALEQCGHIGGVSE